MEKNKKIKPVIDFGELNNWIKEVENLLEPLNASDKDLILTNALNRVRARVQKAKAQDMVDAISPFGLAKKVMKGLGKKSEDE